MHSPLELEWNWFLIGFRFIDFEGVKTKGQVYGWHGSDKNYASTKFIRGRLRLFQLPRMPMDASVIASKPDTTPRTIVNHKFPLFKKKKKVRPNMPSKKNRGRR